MRKIPTAAIFLVAAALLVGGLLVLPFGNDTGSSVDTSAKIAQHPWLFAGVGLVVEVGEALVWTVAFIESFAWALRAPWLGAIAGIAAYSVGFHWNRGLVGILASGWIVLVLNVTYLILRERSKKTAVLCTIGLKWCFLAYAAVDIARG